MINRQLQKFWEINERIQNKKVTFNTWEPNKYTASIGECQKASSSMQGGNTLIRTCAWQKRKGKLRLELQTSVNDVVGLANYEWLEEWPSKTENMRSQTKQWLEIKCMNNKKKKLRVFPQLPDHEVYCFFFDMKI